MQSKEFKVENRHIWSLSCVFFLAPIVPAMIRKGEHELSPSDLEFVNSYVKYGILLDLLLGATMLLSIYNFFQGSLFLQYIVNVLFFIIILGVFVGIFMIFTDKNIFKASKKINYKEIKAGNLDYLFFYLPIYNFYLWYNGDKAIRASRRLKESILFSSFLVMANILFSQSLFVNILFLMFWCVRIISLVGGLDFVSDDLKKKLNNLFEVNPEEIFGYVRGWIVYMYYKMKSTSMKTKTSLAKHIEDAKSYYKLQNDPKDGWMIVQYAILGAGFAYYLWIYLEYFLDFDIYGLIHIVPILVFFFRYLFAFRNGNVPNIPILYEIISPIRKLF